LLAAVALALRAAFECFRTFVNQQPFAYTYLFWWQIAAFIALPLLLLAGMLRARLARASVGELVLALDRAPATPQSPRDALALALELSAAQRRLGSEADPEVERLLAASVEELQSTVEELRTLARGLHPTVLTEYGLAAAFEALTLKSPVPVQLDVRNERLPAQ